MTQCAFIDPVEGQCTSVGLHTRKYHDGYNIIRQLLCEKHWQLALDDEYSKIMLDFQRFVDKLLASPELPRSTWEQRYRALQDEMGYFHEALARMTS